MPFLAPFIPLIASAGASVGSSLLGSKLAQASPRPAEQKVQDLLGQSMQMGQQTAQQVTPQAQNLLSMGAGGYQPVLNYWSSLLSGNRGAMTGAMGPEISRIGQGYQTATNTSAALNPRGGPSASFLSELPFQHQRDVTSLLQTA